MGRKGHRTASAAVPMASPLKRSACFSALFNEGLSESGLHTQGNQSESNLYIKIYQRTRVVL